MNYRKKIVVLFCLFLLITLLTFVYVIANNGIVCNSYSCFDFLFNEKYVLFIFTPLFVSVSLLFVIFFSEQVFGIWKKFAMFAIPLMLIGILLIKVNPMECGVLICVNRTFMIFFSGILYLILSFLVTIISAIILKAK